jgi:hypothetical protein
MDRWINKFKDKREDLMGCVINAFSVRDQVLLLESDNGMICRVVAKMLARRLALFCLS